MTATAHVAQPRSAVREASILSSAIRITSIRTSRHGGCHILHPQQWSFARQVALYQRAEIIAGAEGSALHNSVFVRPGTPVINVGTPRRNSGLTLNQRMCDSLSGAESHLLPFAGTASSGERASYDIDVLRTRLVALLGDRGA